MRPFRIKLIHSDVVKLGTISVVVVDKTMLGYKVYQILLEQGQNLGVDDPT